MATIFETNQTLGAYTLADSIRCCTLGADSKCATIVVKLAWSVRDTGARDRIDRGNTRNREIARRKRMDAKRS